MSVDLSVLSEGIPLDPMPEWRPRDPQKPHAPNHTPVLSKKNYRLALKNALRYFPGKYHATLAPEFDYELKEYGHIYMYRFRPTFPLKAYPINSFPATSQEGAAIMLMILNNLDPNVAQFPDELVTYGGNGQVFSNWAQFWLVMRYLSRLTENNTLVLYSGHPHGLFPSTKNSPRAVITNGMVLPAAANEGGLNQYERLFALGVTQYGQMTAGSFCYIGPQGIVHGTTITLLNAMRRYSMKSVTNHKQQGMFVFVSSGLGGMSGAQPKAGVIAGCISVIAEVSKEALMKRHTQGWLLEVADDLNDVITRVRKYKKEGKSTSIGYIGNVVDLWEALVKHHQTTGELLVELGSDQTSCHNPFLGGYYPATLSYEAARELMHSDPIKFKEHVQNSLIQQVKAINYLAAQGMYFFDYGNAFLLQASRAGADIVNEDELSDRQFRYPSYVQDIMGDIFSMGFGPYRWVCTTCLPEDLIETDHLAEEVISKLMEDKELPEYVKEQYRDNLRWIQKAGEHKLVVGSQARILYSDQAGRVAMALAFNDAIKKGRVRGPVVLSRDHHDVSGTDSPYRETSSVYDGSAECTDMAVHNVIGDSFRGATWVALHNGGGVGWGEVLNGGFGLLLDGSDEAAARAGCMLGWDVANGVTRRAWAGNQFATEAITRTMRERGDDSLEVTLPHNVDTELIKRITE